MSKFIESVEQLKAPRILIDYAISVAIEFDDSGNAGLRKALEEFADIEIARYELKQAD